jgi:hypothetical protein
MSPFQKALIEWSDGNPGAAVFLIGLFSDENIEYALPIMTKVERCKTLRGTNIYVLFSDLCNKDYALTAKLCKKCPDSILEDACSRQDYSGRELIKEYLNS